MESKNERCDCLTHMACHANTDFFFFGFANHASVRTFRPKFKSEIYVFSISALLLPFVEKWLIFYGKYCTFDSLSLSLPSALLFRSRWFNLDGERIYLNYWYFSTWSKMIHSHIICTDDQTAREPTEPTQQSRRWRNATQSLTAHRAMYEQNNGQLCKCIWMNDWLQHDTNLTSMVCGSSSSITSHHVYANELSSHRRASKKRH